MPYRLKLTECLAENLRRIAGDQVGGCLPVGRGVGASAWVHETRKRLKRTRALLRLVRAGIPAKAWRRENEALRDIARALSARRERDVLPATIASLARSADTDLAAALERLRACVEGAGRAGGARPASLAAVARELAAARERLTRLEVSGAPEKLIAAGIAATHRRGRDWLEVAERDGSDDAVHELRKTVQVHWRQMLLVEPAWPDMIGVRARAARALATPLGEHQDLAGLAAAARAVEADGLSREDRRIIASACARQQALIRAEALPAARRLFAADPDAFAAEVASLWRAAGVLRKARKEAAADAEPGVEDAVPETSAKSLPLPDRRPSGRRPRPPAAKLPLPA